jgi:hypothetical protein
VPRRRRSFWTGLLAATFLVLAVLGWIRFQQALYYAALFVQLGAWPGPVYIALGGALWGLAGLAAAWGVWRQARWGAPLARAAGLLFAVTWWADRVWFSPGAGAFTGWPFALGVTVIWLGFVFAATRRF